MKRMFAWTVLFCALFSGSLTAKALDIGPAVNTQIPPLQVTNAAGQPVLLPALTGTRGVVLVFFRSAKWCPFCQAQLIEFREVQAPLEARGFRLAAVSYDPPDVLAKFAQLRQIGYPLLSDKGSVTIDAFAIRDRQYKPDSFAYGVPQPVIFVVSPQGTILAKLAEEGFKVRPDGKAILAAVDALK